MSFSEAKQELKSRGFKDHARSTLHSAVTERKPPSVDDPISSVNIPSVITEASTVSVQNEATDVVNDNIPTSNRFEVLGDNTDPTVDHEMETDKAKGQKRNLDQSSPPKKKKPTGVKCKPSASVEEPMPPLHPTSQQTKKRAPSPRTSIDKMPVSTESSKSDELSPSPILGRPSTRRSRSFDQATRHNLSCGCHNCFLSLCHHGNITSKDKLITLIKNFVKDKRVEYTALESHRKGCMCVNHLKYYKEHHIHVLDNFLGKLQDNISVPTAQNPTTSTTEIQKDQPKHISNYSKISNKSTTSINHKNLTTLT